jgi:cytochrome P450
VPPAPEELSMSPDSHGPVFELGTPGFFLAPDYFEMLAELRRDYPVHRSADGILAVSRYEDVRTISRDPERFVSGRGVLVNDPLRHTTPGADLTGSILHLDPPRHAEYRALVNRRFTPRAVSSLTDSIHKAVNTAVDALPEAGEVEFVEQVAAPIPIDVISDMFGVADADRALFRRWSDAVIESPDRGDTPRAAEQAEDLGQMTQFLLDHIESPAAGSNDLLDLLKSVSLGGRGLNRGEIMGFCMTLLVAGNETTRSLIAGGVEALARHPDQRAALVEDPSLIPGAVEEMLRWVTPIQAFGRTAAVDTEIAGVEIDEGEFLVMLYASANRDEEVFGPTADRFDVTRPALPMHHAFGFGEHVCLGASLARLEARMFFEELFVRYPHFSLAGEPRFTPSTLVRSVADLPIHLDSAV